MSKVISFNGKSRFDQFLAYFCDSLYSLMRWAAWSDEHPCSLPFHCLPFVFQANICFIHNNLYRINDVSHLMHYFIEANCQCTFKSHLMHLLLPTPYQIFSVDVVGSLIQTFHMATSIVPFVYIQTFFRLRVSHLKWRNYISETTYEEYS